MDNASKALIMAGAILISVAVVGIGIYIFSRGSEIAKSSTDSMDQVSTAVVNQGFYNYAAHQEVIRKADAIKLYNYARSVNCAVTGTNPSTQTQANCTITYTYTNGRITSVNFAGRA